MPLPDFEFKKTIEGKNNIEQQTLAEVLHKEKELNNVKITTKAGSIIYSTDIQFVEGDTHLTTKPAGINGAVQFNDGGSFGGEGEVLIKKNAEIGTYRGEGWEHTNQTFLKSDIISAEEIIGEDHLYIQTSSGTRKDIYLYTGKVDATGSSNKYGSDIYIQAGDLCVEDDFSYAMAGTIGFLAGGVVSPSTGKAEGGHLYFGAGWGRNGGDSGDISFYGVTPYHNDGGGSNIDFYAGSGKGEGDGGRFTAFAGQGGSTSGDGGLVYIAAGWGGGTGNGGDVVLQSGKAGSGEGSVEGRVKCFGTLEVGRFTSTGFFFNLSRMTGDEADARTDDENGSMYYRTDDNTIRVKINGVWKTLTTE